MTEKEIKYGLKEEEMNHVCCCLCGGNNIEVILKIVYKLDEDGEVDHDEVLYTTNRYSDPFCVDCSEMTKIVTKKEFVDNVNEFMKEGKN